MASSDGFLAQLKQRLQSEFLNIEQNATLSEAQKIDRIIFTTAAICAGIAIQPIPFADALILTPIQGFMGYKIAQVRGIKLTEAGAAEVMKFLLGVVGAGWLAQHGIIGLYKAGLPFIGGLMTLPLVFGATYAIGRAFDVYFNARKQGRNPSREEILDAFKRGKREGKHQGKTEAVKSASAKATGS